MDTANTSFFDLAERRLAWTNRRAAVLAQNIANSDTPKWRARDLAPFSSLLAHPGPALARTDPMHLARGEPAAGGSVARTGERAPDGNSVALDRELVRVAETDSSHALVSDLYRKYMAMYRTALGK